jgi:hypothetical protein
MERLRRRISGFAGDAMTDEKTGVSWFDVTVLLSFLRS